jgi:hypothetical protein
MSAPRFFGASKHSKEQRRAGKRALKVAKKEFRREAKAAPEQFDNGTFPIADLPVDAQGVSEC